MHHAAHPPVQHVHTIQTWFGTIYSGLAVHHTENRNQEIAGISIRIYTIKTVVDIQVYTSIEDTRAAKSTDAELQMLQVHMIKGSPQTNDKI